jgi:hypothetical protein
MKILKSEEIKFHFFSAAGLNTLKMVSIGHVPQKEDGNIHEISIH